MQTRTSGSRTAKTSRSAGPLVSAALYALGAALATATPARAAGASATPAPSGTAAASAVQHFDILEFVVLGNSALPVRAVEGAVYPYEGPNKTISDIQSARTSLERAYRNAGYGTVVVDIPEQSVSDGEVRLRVLEGKLDRIRISGARYFSERKILAALPALRHGTTPQLPELQQELAQVNRQSTDRTVTPVLRAGRTPGTVDVDLQVKDTAPLHGSVALNNRYTPDTSALRTILDLSYGNLFQDFNSVSFEYQTAPQRAADARVFALTYALPLGASGNVLALYAVDTHSDVAAIGTLAVLGVGQIYGLRLIHPLDSPVTSASSLTFGADYKNFTETVNLLTGGLDQTPIRYTNWSVAYSLNAGGARHSTQLALTGNFGVRGAPNDPAAFDYKRFDAKADYAYLRLSVEHDHVLPLGTSAVLRLLGQYASGPLISNEQVGIGGFDTVRGYLESVALGDQGGAADFEVHSPAWGFLGDRTDNQVLLLAFYDTGFVDVDEPLPSEIRRMRLESTGLGLRLKALRMLEGSLDWAYILRADANAVRGDSRVLFQVRFGF